MLKRFLQWIKLKEKLHNNDKWPPPFVSERDMYVCLNQIRTLDYRRLSTRLGKVDGNDFKKVRKGFEKLYL